MYGGEKEEINLGESEYPYNACLSCIKGSIMVAEMETIKRILGEL